MRQHSVLLTVLFALVVTLFSVSLVFWEFYKLNKKQYIDNMFSQYSTMNQIYREHLQRKSSEIMLEANLAVYSFRVEKSKVNQKTILKNCKILKQEGFQTVAQ